MVSVNEKVGFLEITTRYSPAILKWSSHKSQNITISESWPEVNTNEKRPEHKENNSRDYRLLEHCYSHEGFHS